MRRVFFLALALLACQTVAAADLIDIYRAALASDPVYAAARASWEAGQEKLPQGRAGLLPQADFSASTQRIDRDLRFRNPALAPSQAQYNSNSASVSITQPLFRRQNLVAYDQGKTQVALADVQLASAAQNLILRVSQAYFDVLLARNNVVLAQAQKTAIGQQLEQAKRNFEVGNATITDTHEAQARFDLITAQEIAARNDLEVKNRALEQLIGRAAPDIATVGKNFALQPPEPQSMEQWVEMARKDGLQVRIAQENLKFSTLDVQRNRGAHYPTLDAYATATESGAGSGVQGGSGTDISSKTIGLQLAIPIFQGGLVSSRVREAIANETKAQQDLENARRSAELAARQNYLGVTNGIAQVRALEAALVSNQSSLDSTRLGQEVGVRTQVDVLNAQQLLFSARRDLAQSRYNYIQSVLLLKAAAGQLTETDLQIINGWLEK